MANDRPFLQLTDLDGLSVVGGYSNVVAMTELTNVFLLSAMLVMRMRFIWESSIQPISDSDYEQIIDLIEDVETQLMENQAVGSLLWSVATIVSDSIIPLQGQLLLQSDFPELTSVVPLSWLVGMDIQLPDMRDKGLFGATNPLVVGNLIGSNNVVLGVSEIPSHTHTQNPHAHSEVIPSVTPTGAGPVVAGASLVIPIPSVTGVSTAINNPTGGGNAHENIQASLQAIAYMIVR